MTCQIWWKEFRLEYKYVLELDYTHSPHSINPTIDYLCYNFTINNMLLASSWTILNYRAIGNYCDAGSTLFGAEISISHKFCFFKNFCLGYDLSDNMKYFFCVMNFWPQKGLRRQRGWDSKSSQAIYSSNP